jgi:hypothetical protein
MNDATPLLLKTEDLLCDLLAGRQPGNQQMLELLQQISEWLVANDPERN